MQLRKYQKEDIKGKRILLRCDLDVKTDGNGFVDEFAALRLKKIVPQIQDLIHNEASQIVIIGHKGRPERRDSKFSLAGICESLSCLLSEEETLEPICFVDDIFADPGSFLSDRLVMLENTRFWDGEKSSDPNFAKTLARWGEVYINNAFGSSHRRDASIFNLPYVCSNHFAGTWLTKEVEELELFKKACENPFVVILGGAKISTKLPLIKELISSSDYILIGGAMANTALESRGINIGKSLTEELPKAELAFLDNDKILLPQDAVVDSGEIIDIEKIEDNMSILDIGPKTVEDFINKINSAKSILWNGPMGKFEDENFAKGTKQIACAIADAKSARTLAGGGETIEMIEMLGLADEYDFISTGGGAMLAFLSGEVLPGLEALVK